MRPRLPNSASGGFPVLGGLGGGGVRELRELSVPSSPGFSGCQGFGDLTLKILSVQRFPLSVLQNL